MRIRETVHALDERVQASEKVDTAIEVSRGALKAGAHAVAEFAGFTHWLAKRAFRPLFRKVRSEYDKYRDELT